MDARLAAAIGSSRRWYDDIFAAHGVPTAVEGSVWRALRPPPRWHSAAKTLAASAPEDRVVRAVERFGRCSVADSFGVLDLAGAGFDPLFHATWVHRPAPAPASARLPEGWSVIRERGMLQEWNARHDTVGVLLPSLLGHPRFTFLARRSGRLAGGAVLHDPGGSAVGLSNTWAARGEVIDTEALLRCASAVHPGRDVVGYADGEELAALLAAGFDRLGPHVVWAR